MNEVSVYNLKGEIVGKEKLSDFIFGLKVKPQVVYQAAVAQNANSREVLAHTKTRGEVRGGGKKPWKQKGTGRARHGSNRSPIWIGGGITFGPRNNRNFSLKINSKIKRSALLMCLSDKALNEKIYIIEDSNFEKEKTKNVFELFQNLKLREGKKKDSVKKSQETDHAFSKVLVVLPKEKKGFVRVFRNIPKVDTIAANSLNVRDLLANEYLLLSKESLAQIESVYGKKN